MKVKCDIDGETLTIPKGTIVSMTLVKALVTFGRLHGHHSISYEVE